MGKRGKVINPKRFSRNRGVASDDMDDEIDAFHKQRDIIMRMVILSLISRISMMTRMKIMKLEILQKARSSDDEGLLRKEEAVLKLKMQKAKSYTMKSLAMMLMKIGVI